MNSQMAEIRTLIEEINRDAWSDDKTRMRVIARTSDELLKLLNAPSGPSSREAVLEEALEQYAMRPGYDGDIARIALKTSAPSEAGADEVTPAMIEAGKGVRVNLHFMERGISGFLSDYEVKTIYERMAEARRSATSDGYQP